LPKAFGPWEAVDKRCRRGEQSGVWQRLGAGLRPDKCPGARQLWMDRTRVRAPPQAAGAFKKTAAQRPRLGAVLGEACPPTGTSGGSTSGPESRS